MDATSTAGIVFTLANSIPVYKMMKDMNPRGKIINTALVGSRYRGAGRSPGLYGRGSSRSHYSGGGIKADCGCSSRCIGDVNDEKHRG